MSIIINPYAFSSSSPAVSLPASTVFNLEASNTDSYDGSTDLQTWKNTIASPADGSSQSDYDAWLGNDGTASTDDPSFSTDKFVYDGADMFLLKNRTTFTETLSRSDQSNNWWALSHFKTATLAGSFISIFSASSSSATEHGAALLIDESNNRLQLWRRNATGNTNAINLTSVGVIQNNTQYLVIVGYNSSTGAWSLYLNGKSLDESGTSTPPTSTTSSTDHIGIGGADGAAGSRFTNGSEQYQFAMGNDSLTSGIVSDLVDYVNNSSGTSYS